MCIIALLIEPLRVLCAHVPQKLLYTSPWTALGAARNPCLGAVPTCCWLCMPCPRLAGRDDQRSGLGSRGPCLRLWGPHN